MKRRTFLKSAAVAGASTSAGVFAILKYPRGARAAGWGVWPSDKQSSLLPAEYQVPRVLELNMNGGMNPWDTFYGVPDWGVADFTFGNQFAPGATGIIPRRPPATIASQTAASPARSSRRWHHRRQRRRSVPRSVGLSVPRPPRRARPHADRGDEPRRRRARGRQPDLVHRHPPGPAAHGRGRHRDPALLQREPRSARGRRRPGGAVLVCGLPGRLQAVQRRLGLHGRLPPRLGAAAHRLGHPELRALQPAHPPRCRRPASVRPSPRLLPGGIRTSGCASSGTPPPPARRSATTTSSPTSPASTPPISTDILSNDLFATIPAPSTICGAAAFSGQDMPRMQARMAASLLTRETDAARYVLWIDAGINPRPTGATTHTLHTVQAGRTYPTPSSPLDIINRTTAPSSARLDDTMIVINSEFGRTPGQQTKHRDQPPAVRLCQRVHRRADPHRGLQQRDRPMQPDGYAMPPHRDRHADTAGGEPHDGAAGDGHLPVLVAVVRGRRRAQFATPTRPRPRPGCATCCLGIPGDDGGTNDDTRQAPRLLGLPLALGCPGRVPRRLRPAGHDANPASTEARQRARHHRRGTVGRAKHRRERPHELGDDGAPQPPGDGAELCDAGDEAWAKRVIPLVQGRRPESIREIRVLTQMVSQLDAHGRDGRDRWPAASPAAISTAIAGRLGCTTCCGSTRSGDRRNDLMLRRRRHRGSSRPTSPRSSGTTRSTPSTPAACSAWPTWCTARCASTTSRRCFEPTSSPACRRR